MSLGFALGFVLTFQSRNADPATGVGTGARQIPSNLADLEFPEADDDATVADRTTLRQKRQRLRFTGTFSYSTLGTECQNSVGQRNACL